jgi:hypothetical protein
LQQKKCDKKIAAEKVRQKNRSKKKCGRKITAEKVWQKNRGNNMVGVYL